VSATECHTGTIDSDINMVEIRAENELRLAAMNKHEILAKQKDLLSALGLL